MSNKHSEAATKRWKKVPAEERSKMASHASRARWDNMSKEDRLKVAKSLVKARNKKKAHVRTK